MLKPSVVFRADGHASMGLGHLLRSAALAEMLTGPFACYLAYRYCPDSLLQQLSGQFAGIQRLACVEPGEESQELVRYARSVPTGNTPPIVILDGYHFNTDYQRTITLAGLPLVCIDDIYAYHFVADIVINHAGGVQASQYSAEPYTKFLLGPQYALLRAPFRDGKVARRDPEPKEIFVCLGGADPPNATLDVVQQIVTIFPEYTTQVVVGAAYCHMESLSTFVGNCSSTVKVHHGIDAATMASLMSGTQYGITSPSTVSFEYLSVGGILYLLPIADNQTAIYRYYTSEGLAFSFETDFPVEDNVRLARSYTNRAALFDGKIQQRYREAFATLISP